MKRIKQRYLLALLSGTLLIYSPLSSAAYTPIGLWKITSYKIDSATGNLVKLRTDSICFKNDTTLASTDPAVPATGRWSKTGLDLRFNTWTPVVNVFTASSVAFTSNSSFGGSFMANVLQSGTTLMQTQSGTISAIKVADPSCPAS